MHYELISADWNAEPNDPDIKLSVNGNTVTLEFYLNYFQFERFTEGEKGLLIFHNCHKYALNSMNDEGYYQGNYRYTQQDLPWGEFYKLETNWEIDFPSPNHKISIVASTRLNHYIFFFRDNTFECVAEKFSLKFMKDIEAA